MPLDREHQETTSSGHTPIFDTSWGKYFLLPVLASLVTAAVLYLITHPDAGGGFYPFGAAVAWSKSLIAALVVESTVMTVCMGIVLPMELIYIYARRGQTGNSPFATNGKRSKPLYDILVWFAAQFIFIGLTKFFALVDIWHTYYWYEVVFRGIAAFCSIMTALAIYHDIPALTGVLTELELTKRLTAIEEKLNHLGGDPQ